MKMIYRIAPWLLLLLFLGDVAGMLAPKKDGDFHIREFAKLPVLMNGRIQPFDSVARNSLLQIRGTAEVPLEEVPSWQFWHHARKLKSTEWLLELMANQTAADNRPIFLIHNPELLGDLKLEDKGVDKSGLRYYTFREIEPVLPEIRSQNIRARKVEESVQTPLQRQVVKLGNALAIYTHLRYTLQPEGTKNFSADVTEITQSIEPGVKAVQAADEGKPYDKAAYDTLSQTVENFTELKKDSAAGTLYPLAFPPSEPAVSRNEWGNVGMAVVETIRQRGYEPLAFLADIVTSYQHGDATTFNTSVSGYAEWLKKDFSKELSKGKNEFFYNETKGFLHAMIMYVSAFVLTAFGLLTFGTFNQASECLRKSAFLIILLAFVVHTSCLIFRMVLENRPPVTNLYSSAIFIGWGAVFLGVILEKIFKIGIGNAVASVAGFITLLIAHNLALNGDTMEMLRAVLDTNFWLATHVVVVTLGYASTFVAGLLALIYILLGVFTPVLAQKIGGSKAPAIDAKSKDAVKSTTVGKALPSMVYGIVCFATLFSFVGTVLGGIWADQSWGRFWGWDPKENGALIIVIWNAVVLHARWGGMIRERGLMVMAIVGNIVTSFSWFGVNMLGIGLHSYGFMDKAFDNLKWFIISQLLLIALGLIPVRYWRSYRPAVTPKIDGPAAGKPAAA